MSASKSVSAQNLPSFASEQRHLLLRGGRTTRHKGVVGGIAPRSGLVSAVMGAAAMLIGALGGMTFQVSAAFAGDCGPAPTVTCSGAAAPGDVEQSYTDPGGLTITTEAGFGLDVGMGGYGITISASGVGDVRFIDEHASTIRAEGRALDISAFGQGEVEVKSTGNIIGEGIYGLYLGTGIGVTGSTIDVNRVESENYIGMRVENQGGALSITSHDAIIGGSASAPFNGLQIDSYISATGGILVDVADVKGSAAGVSISQQGKGLVTVNSSGTIEGVQQGDGRQR